MTTTNTSIIEGVDNDVLLAFLTLFVITFLTIIYYLNVNRSIATFSESWVNLWSFIARQTARLSSLINQGNQNQSSRETTQENAANSQRTDHSANQHQHGQSDTVNHQNSGQTEEFARQTFGGHPEDIQGRTCQDSCPSQGNVNSNSTENQGGRDEGGGSGSDDVIRQRTGFGSSATQSSTEAQPSGSQVSVRVKHHEVERSFTVDPSITVRELKRLSFPDEMAQGRRVRFIYSGHLLNDDNASISFYGVSNYSVVHAQISDIPHQNSTSQHGDDEIELDISRLFIPLLAVILCACWYGLLSYRSLFNTSSTAILFVITAAYTFMVYVMFS